jgi:uncharacterized protein YndB with AHSA1/START domain
MTDRNFTVSFTVAESPEDVFAAINNVRGWWSEEIEGLTDKVGGVFWYHFKHLHRCTVKVTDLVPGKRVAWHVLDNTFSFTRDKTEWTGTDVVFEITGKGSKTELRFIHQGLVPEDECYEACSDGWSTYIKKSLRNLIATGKGRPNVGEPATETERALVR